MGLRRSHVIGRQKEPERMPYLPAGKEKKDEGNRKRAKRRVKEEGGKKKGNLLL